jgi:hypothetical protein
MSLYFLFPIAVTAVSHGIVRLKKYMAERRRLERFDLTAPARLFVESESRETEQLDLTTKDISSSGAFLYCSSQPLVEGVRVKMEFLISLDKL